MTLQDRRVGSCGWTSSRPRIARPSTQWRPRGQYHRHGGPLAHRRLRAFADVVVRQHGRVRIAPTCSHLPSWCARSDVLEPATVKRATVRRYLAHLTTRQFARRTIARKTAAIRRYYRWLRRERVRAGRPDQRRLGSRWRWPAASCARPARADWAARRARPTSTSRRGDAAATTRCSSCCTARGCASANCAG